MTRKAIRTVLELHDYNVLKDATNGKEAINLYQELKPDLVLMDIAMPKMHGIDAIQEILKYDEKAKIIAITALYSPEKIKEVKQSGVSDIIIKPFKIADMIHRIDTTLTAS
jgi:two-component system chemotaxis response regulator CheY